MASQTLLPRIVAGITETWRALKMGIIAEGIETKGEYEFLASKGIRLFQGYFFARPGFRSLPPISEAGLQALLG
ncbi:MAG: EAL domain-containing protein [Archangium sp.]|nr:EAL domain-containing protein [Archangium sp.]MDP3157385.1 EAL domain-containing protein [Archangium sp.]MDP3571223.1 EAL domain-containing protein [Archangium sp.]